MPGNEGEKRLLSREMLGWELTAAAVDELGSIGCYREPAGHLWIFVTIDAIARVRR